MPRNKQLKISSETIYLYAPLAHRLGLYAIKSELEDLYLKFSESSTYLEILRKIDTSKEARNRFIKRFIRPLQNEMAKGTFNYEIKGRPKSVHSVWNKMKVQDIPFEEVYDLFAIRIILDTSLEDEKAACWRVYSVVTDFYKPNPDRLRDWISTPKANGYESLHTTVMSNDGQWVEVQIRTRRMDEIAEKGYAAHWKYKGSHDAQESGLEQWIGKVRELLEQNEGSAIEFVDDFKSNLFQEEVFVFTPQGDLKRLPHGATALDFAFEIHSQVGAKCLGAKVNQKLVPLNHVLNNGDQVEILTSEKQKPTEDWLRFVVSSKARSKIKDSLKSDKKKVATDGKEMMLRKMKRLKIEPSNENFDRIRAFFNVNNQLDLFYNVSKGIVQLKDLKLYKEQSQNIEVNGKKKVARVTDAKSFGKEIEKAKGRKDDILFIGEDMDIFDYKFAKCCTPIPGDDVFGFVSVNEGIKIHRTSCPNAPELLSNHGHRVVKAKWASKHEESFKVGLEIIGTDRVGLINDVTGVISSELKVNMRSISVDTDTGIFEGKIVLYINDTKHLDVLITKLEQVSGVVKVKRFDYSPDDEPVNKQA
jgi:GTP pyrophosphokinase